MRVEVETSRLFNAQDEKDGKDYIYRDAKELLGNLIKTQPSKGSAIATAAIYFDSSGKILNMERPLSEYKAKLSRNAALILIGGKNTAKPYWFADWEQGMYGDVKFLPGVCVTTDTDRYRDNWQPTDRRGHVGCREWAAQLYQKTPYINVTTYSSKGNFIGEVVGWARFEDSPTPIIGMQGKQWLCLHECPAGEQPGIIPDIQVWTRKHGFPMPVPPAKQPMYPNKDYDEEFCQLSVANAITRRRLQGQPQRILEP